MSNKLITSKSVLDPFDRVSEILCGLIMVITFTGSLSVAQAGPDDVRTMLIGALGCNVAWGIIDSVLYLMGCLVDKVHDQSTLRALRASTDPGETQRLMVGALPSAAAAVLHPAEFEAMHQRLKQLPEPPVRARLSRNDWLGALGVFSVNFSATLPVVIPFMFMKDAVAALRVSHAIAIVTLFVTGYAFGRHGNRAWMMGISMVVLGLILVSITMALGG